MNAKEKLLEERVRRKAAEDRAVKAEATVAFEKSRMIHIEERLATLELEAEKKTARIRAQVEEELVRERAMRTNAEAAVKSEQSRIKVIEERLVALEKETDTADNIRSQIEDQLAHERVLRVAAEGRASKAEADAQAERSKTKVMEDRLADLEKDNEEEAGLQTQKAVGGGQAQELGSHAWNGKVLQGETDEATERMEVADEAAQGVNLTRLEAEQGGIWASDGIEIVSFNLRTTSPASMEMDDCREDNCQGPVRKYKYPCSHCSN